MDLVRSTSEALRLIKQKAVKIDQAPVLTNVMLDVDTTPRLIQVGKRRLAKVRLHVTLLYHPHSGKKNAYRDAKAWQKRWPHLPCLDVRTIALPMALVPLFWRRWHLACLSTTRTTASGPAHALRHNEFSTRQWSARLMPYPRVPP